MKVRYSDLIRIGAARTGITTGSFTSSDDEGNLQLCARGAAVYAKASLEEGTFREGIPLNYSNEPEVVKTRIQPEHMPYDYDVPDYLLEVIVNLNDERLWSREKIADWVDELIDEHGYDLHVDVDLHAECFCGGDSVPANPQEITVKPTHEDDAEPVTA